VIWFDSLVSQSKVQRHLAVCVWIMRESLVWVTSKLTQCVSNVMQDELSQTRMWWAALIGRREVTVGRTLCTHNHTTLSTIAMSLLLGHDLHVHLLTCCSINTQYWTRFTVFTERFIISNGVTIISLRALVHLWTSNASSNRQSTTLQNVSVYRVRHTNSETFTLSPHWHMHSVWAPWPPALPGLPMASYATDNLTSVVQSP